MQFRAQFCHFLEATELSFLLKSAFHEFLQYSWKAPILKLRSPSASLLILGVICVVEIATLVENINFHYHDSKRQHNKNAHAIENGLLPAPSIACEILYTENLPKKEEKILSGINPAPHRQSRKFPLDQRRTVMYDRISPL